MNAQTLPLPEPHCLSVGGPNGKELLYTADQLRQHEQAVRERIEAGIAGLALPKPWDLQHDDDGRPHTLYTSEQLTDLRTAAQQVALGAEGKKL